MQPQNCLYVLSQVVHPVRVCNVQGIHQRNDSFKASHLIRIVLKLNDRNHADDVRDLADDLSIDNRVDEIF